MLHFDTVHRTKNPLLKIGHIAACKLANVVVFVYISEDFGHSFSFADVVFFDIILFV